MRRALPGLMAALLALVVAGCENLLTRPILYGSVTVQANSRAGTPLAGIEAILYTGARPMGYGRTDARGRYVFSRVPPGQYGIYIVLSPTVADLSELEGGAPRNVVDGLNIDAGIDTTLRFTFAARGDGSAEALVREESGAPLENLEVVFYNSRGVLGSARTDTAGIARFSPVAFGQVGMFITPPDSLGVPNSPTVFRDGFVVDAEIAPRAVFTLPTCRGTVRVAVRDQATLPVAGIEVLLYDSRSVRRRVSTGADGDVVLPRVGCGNYGVMLGAAPPGYQVTGGRGQSFVDGILLATRDSVVRVTLQATRIP